MSVEWLRRQRPALAQAAEAPVAVHQQSASKADVDAELAALREKASKLQAQLTEEIVRAHDADRALDSRDATIRDKDRIIASLERALAQARRAVPGTPWDGAEREPLAGTEAAHWHRIAHELQERVLQLQTANEAHDRHAARGRR